MTPTIRTPAEIIASCTEHFTHMAEWTARHTGDSARGKDDQELAAAFLDAVLAAPPGERFPVWAWLDTTRWADKPKNLGNMLPYFSGSLQVLDMEFYHASLGELPLEIVQKVLRAEGAPVLYEGVALDPNNVEVHFRRTVEEQRLTA